MKNLLLTIAVGFARLLLIVGVVTLFIGIVIGIVALLGYSVWTCVPTAIVLLAIFGFIMGYDP